jgi:sialidase-1
MLLIDWLIYGFERKQKTRKVAISKNGGLNWEDNYLDYNLIDPICQASVLSVNKRRKTTLYFLNPANKNKRENMTLKISKDKGKTWSVFKTLFFGVAAYSDLTLLANGNLGCFYEAGINGPYEGDRV